jgi:zinc protease
MARRPRLTTWRGLEVDLPVAERTLANGLRALVLPRRHVPIVVCDLYYPVGSFDEPPGLTGLAHFVEHMLFKGTDRFPKGEIDRLVLVAAGQSNAETGEDSTHYWFTLPSDRWELALKIEADRMTGVRFDPREVEIERQVIGEERSRELNTSSGRLEQTHLALSFLRHPYRNPIVGWPEDLARIDAQALQNFYRAHYRPDGAVLVIVGDVEPCAALDFVASHLEGVPAGPLVSPRPPVAEADQSGRRDFALSEPDSSMRGLFGWRAVPRCHRDAPALEVLADLLCCGRRSRLWHALVETAKNAVWVESGYHGAQRAGQFFVQLEAAGGADPAAIEQQIADQLSSLADAGPSPDEIARARRRLHSAWRWEQEDLASLAAGLGTAALWGDWRAWQAEHRAALTVEAQEIRQVVQNYLTDDNLTAGWSIPRARNHRVRSSEKTAGRILPGRAAARQASPQHSKSTASEHLLPRDPAATERPDGRARPPASLIVPMGIPRLIDYRPRRTVLDNGLRLVYDRRPGSGVVAVELFADAGLLREAKPGLSALTGRLLEEGTTTRSAQELSQEIEDVGGSLEFGSTGGSLRICCEDLARGLTLLADGILRPAFPAEAVGWVSRRLAAELRADLEDPAFRTELSFRSLIYGSHPLARDPRGGAAELKRLTGEDIRAHHHRYFAPENAIVVAVGDFEPRRLVSLVNECFGNWAAHTRSLPRPAPVQKSPRPRVRRIRHAGEQVHIMLGHLGIARNHPDYDALAVLDCIFGSGPGFCDRLGRIVRDELGLAYTIGGSITDSADVVPGLFRVYAGTMPEGVDRVVATITEQIRAMHAGAFSDLEVDRARCYLAGAWAFDFQTVEQRADRLLELERWGLDLGEPRRRPERISAITSRQVRHAARRHLQPEALCRVELGPRR